MRVARLALFVIVLFLSGFAMGGTLTVTSPTNGQYVGTSNQLNFNISGAKVQVSLSVTVTYPTNATSTFSQNFTPDSSGNISSSVALNFTPSDPKGQYKIAVSATEPGNTYAPTNLTVTLVPQAPQFLSYSPVDGSFLKGTVHIRASLSSSFLQSWRVQVNSQDIPSNTGSTSTVAVNWDTSGVLKDGQQTITVTATDLANQTTSKTMNVTVIRVPPIITFAYPTSSTTIVPGTDVVVLLNIQTEFAGSLDRTGVQIFAERTNGAYIGLVALSSFDNSTTTARWAGRIRYQKGLLPQTFRLVATATDKAGNTATPQITTITLSQ